MNNFQSFTKQFEKIQERIEDEVNGNVSFEELFDLGFMDKNTDFESFEELLKHYGFVVNTQEDFEAIDETSLDKAIAESSCFSSWKEMYESAGQEYVYKKLKDAGFDVTR